MAVLTELERKGVKARSLCADSRAVRSGDVFVAFPGARVDGRRFIAAAVANGAQAVLYEKTNAGAIEATIPSLAVDGLAALSGEIAHLVYGRPSEKISLIGVTGTNGKTSVSQWIAQAFHALGRKCAVMGTLGNGFPGALEDSPNTTPDAIVVHRLLKRYVDQGAGACAMEVSSIGLDQGRVNGARFATAVFTNLTRDHLDYHGDMAGYGKAKAALFEMPGLAAAVINLDDGFGRQLARRLSGRVPVIGYTLDVGVAPAPRLAENHGAAPTDEVLTAENLSISGDRLRFTLRGLPVTVPLIGRFNASNLLAVIGALIANGVALPDAIAAVAGLHPPPGRLQTVGGNGQPLAVVDYAHTPDALEKALETLRETASTRGGKLICVFGSGGDRDAGKRPLMGAVAERLADRVVLTSDNPRDENPDDIIAAIRAGMRSMPLIEPDRAKAIDVAIIGADPRDVILFAGKGHEPYQEIAGVRHPFSDAARARAALERRA